MAKFERVEDKWKHLKEDLYDNIKPELAKEEMREIGFMLLDYQQRGFLPPWPDEKRLKANRIINKVLRIAEIKRCGHSTYDYDDELEYAGRKIDGKV